MASKFKIWVDDTHLNNVQSYDVFASDGQRTAGFVGGTPASSIRVNTALRQANLVACALMELVDSTGTVDFRNKVSDVQTLINTYLTTKLITLNSSYATKIGASTNHPAIGTLDRIMRVNDQGQLVADGYFIPKLNGNNQTTSGNNFYAPTIPGTSGQVLKSNGSGAPTWVNQNTLNVGNATTLQNVNFNSSTKAEFGDYVVPKKKILWQGNQYSGWSTSDDYVDIDLNTDLSDKIIEVEYSDNSLLLGFKKFCRFKINSNQSNNFNFFVTNYSITNDSTVSSGSAQDANVQLFWFKITAPQNDTLRFSSTTQTNLSSSFKSTHIWNTNITAIYEIIE